MKWNQVPFEDLYIEPSRNGLMRPKKVRGTGFKMVNMGELFRYPRINDPEMERVPMDYKEIERFHLKTGDLLFARQSLVAEGAGKCSIVMSTPEITTFESHLIRVRMDPKKALPLFYFYYFRSPQGYGNIQSLVVQVAAAGIRGGELAKLLVPLPKLNEQKRIASILSSYDDLIENNTRRIQILEEMAQRIYTEWFVDFRFPGHEKVKFVDSELGRIPSGWEVKSIEGVCRKLTDGDWIETKDQGGNDYRLLQVSNIGLGCFHETGNFRYITENTFNSLRCTEILTGDILISRMPKPTGRAWLVTEMPWRMITAVDVAIAKADSNKVSSMLLLNYLNSKPTLDLVEKHQTGTTRPRISRKALGALPILVPPKKIQDRFEIYTLHAYRLESMLHKKNALLRQTRDLLLPKLISGEVDVSEMPDPKEAAAA